MSVLHTKGYKKLFVLDTNILIHDPYAIFQFEEHDLFLPMVVLEELDNLKKGITETARNVRRATHFLDSVMQKVSYEQIVQGLALNQVVPNGNSHEHQSLGRLFFQTEVLSADLPTFLETNKNDNQILVVTCALQNKYPDRPVVLVTKDINMRIKATINGLLAEDYFNDQVVDNIDELRKGVYEVGENFWDTHSKELSSWQDNGRSFYKVLGDDLSDYCTNDCLYWQGEQPFSAIVREVGAGYVVLEHAKDYSQANHAVWGITARNIEQNFALNHLLNPDIDLITLQGLAGSGKTLLSLAASLMQTIDKNIFQEIIMTRVTVPLGEDIGFLPGSEEEKMTPWMGALMDNLDVLNSSEDKTDWEKKATADLLSHRLKVRSMNFMRGRTFYKKFLIIDEAQNLTSKQLKTLITRAGPGTKMVILGDIQQIDTPYLNEVTSGFTYVIDRFKHCPYSAHITLMRGERSRLAEYAATSL